MKRLITILLFGFMPLLLFAQTTVDSLPDGISGIFLSFTALVAGIPLAVEVAKGIVRPTKRAFVVIVSYLTGISITMFGWYFQLGFLSGLIWWHAMIVGVFASLAANGVYDTKFYTWLLRSLRIT